MSGQNTAGNTTTPPPVDIPEDSSIFDRIIEGAVGRALDHSDARTVYGEPTTHGDRTVIPVARISTGFGFGGGVGQGPENNKSTGSGGGGGGRVHASPIGYIEVTQDATRFMPIQDTTAIAVRAVTLFGLAVVILAFGLMRKMRAD